MASLPAYERRQKLEAWLDAFHRAQAGQPTDDPVLLALTDTQRRFKIPVELLDQLAYGTGMDIQEDAGVIGSQRRFRFFTGRLEICASIVIALLRWWDWCASAYLAIGMRRRNRWRKIWDWRFN